MDSFGVFFLISVGGYILFRIIRSSIKSEYRDTIKRYWDNYPRAYKEAFPHDYISDWELKNMSFSELSSRANYSEQVLRSREAAIQHELQRKRQEEEERRRREYEESRRKAEAVRQAKLEAERRQREIDDKYNRLIAKYPNGVRIYKREHPNTSAKDRIITISQNILKDYEENYLEYDSFVKWKKAQNDFSNKCRKLRDDYLSTWGAYYYEAVVSGKSDVGKTKSFGFGVWQLFCEGYCISKNIDYKYYPQYETNASQVHEFINQDRHFNTHVYDQLLAFLNNLPESSTICLADCGLPATWPRIEDYHFSYLKKKLTESHLIYTSIDNISEQGHELSGNVVVIELVSSNDRLKEYCSVIFNGCKKKNLTLVYVSLMKEFDEDEVINLNKRKEEAIKQEEENKRREQEEKIRKEREESERRAKEVREAEERRKREEAERRKREEQLYLHRVSHTLKPNATILRNYLVSNGVRYFYHFTDRRNLESIKRMGGLYSWRYCEDHGINIPFPGGDGTSRSLDSRHGLSDYVRLSFCTDHPMKWVLEQKGYNMVLLRVKIDVACLEGTLFSDINATDNNHHHGGTLEDLKRINIPATQQSYVSRDSDIFKQHQAEVMVKTFIPLEYIEFAGLIADSPTRTIFPGNSGYRPISDSYRHYNEPSDDLPF